MCCACDLACVGVRKPLVCPGGGADGASPASRPSVVLHPGVEVDRRDAVYGATAENTLVSWMQLGSVGRSVGKRRYGETKHKQRYQDQQNHRSAHEYPNLSRWSPSVTNCSDGEYRWPGVNQAWPQPSSCLATYTQKLGGIRDHSTVGKSNQTPRQQGAKVTRTFHAYPVRCGRIVTSSSRSGSGWG